MKVRVRVTVKVRVGRRGVRCAEVRGGIRGREFLSVDGTKILCFFVGMRTVNLTVDDETWLEARKLAAERDMSVSALVREQLRELTRHRLRQEQARQEILAMIGTFGGEVGAMPSREERNARE